MRILMLCWRDTSHPEGGGSERYLERVAGHLVEQGHDVMIRAAAYPGGAAHETLASGVQISRAGGHLSVYARAWWAMWWARFGFGSLGKFGRPDVVVDVQNGVPFFAHIFAGAPTVMLTHHCHREQWPVAGPILGRIGWFIEGTISPWLHRKLRWITVSEPSAKELRALGIPADSIDIVRNGVDPAPADAQLGSPADHAGPHLVVLSRLVPHKQIEHAIDATARLATQFPDIHLDIVGSGWWHDKLVEHVRNCGIENHVTFHGHAYEYQKHTILSRSSIMLLPSRKEGWGLVVIEAGLHAVPTIGYRYSGGLCDSVVDGVTGVLVDDTEGFISAVRQLLADEPRRHQMGAAAQERAQQFSWQRTAAAVGAVLAQAADDESQHKARPSNCHQAH